MWTLLLWGIRRRFHRLSPRYGQVAHALRTLPPVAARRRIATLPALPLDLHVLSLPLAFILSQDQTLLCILLFILLELDSPDALNSKRIDALDLLVLGTCLYFPSVLSKIFFTSHQGVKNPTLSSGIAKVQTFFDSAILFAKKFTSVRRQALQVLREQVREYPRFRTR